MCLSFDWFTFSTSKLIISSGITLVSFAWALALVGVMKVAGNTMGSTIADWFTGLP